MTKIVLFNKPYNVLCQFTDKDGRRNLSDYMTIPGIYPAGRLDRDSEGLVLLTDDGKTQHKIASPQHKLWKTYLVQVDGEFNEHAQMQLINGIKLKDGQTRPARVKRVPTPQNIWPRDPPVRYRAKIPTSWIEIAIREGKNRQIRRMTAAVGYPALRLIRISIGLHVIDDLLPGQYQIAE